MGRLIWFALTVYDQERRAILSVRLRFTEASLCFLLRAKPVPITITFAMIIESEIMNTLNLRS